MFTNEEANHLLQLPKKILLNDQLTDTVTIRQQFPFNLRYLLGSEADNEFLFMVEVKQSSKFSLKFDLHNQEDQTKIGLIRINYFGKHKNPEIANDKVPAVLHKYAGKWFDYDEHHIHIYVEGYRLLDWAMPLIDDPFPIKEIKNNSNIVDAFIHFCKRINLITKINLEESLL